MWLGGTGAAGDGACVGGGTVDVVEGAVGGTGAVKCAGLDGLVVAGAFGGTDAKGDADGAVAALTDGVVPCMCNPNGSKGTLGRWFDVGGVVEELDGCNGVACFAVAAAKADAIALAITSSIFGETSAMLSNFVESASIVLSIVASLVLCADTLLPDDVWLLAL